METDFALEILALVENCLLFELEYNFGISNQKHFDGKEHLVCAQ